VEFAPSGAVVASGGVDGVIRFWDAQTGEGKGEIRSDMAGGVWALAYVSNGREVAAGGDGVMLWDVTTHRPRGPFDGPGDRINFLAASADGTRLAGTSYDGLVCVWDAATGRLLGRSDAGVGVAWVTAFTPDGGVLSGGGGVYRDGHCEPGNCFTIRLWAVGSPD
jgi:WD40 repeat protein